MSKSTPPFEPAKFVERLRLNSKALVDELYDVVLRQLDAEERRGSLLTSKASALLGQTGLAITVTVAVAGLFAQEHGLVERLTKGWICAVLVIFLLALLCGLTSSVMAITVLRVRSDYQGVDENVVFDPVELEAADAAPIEDSAPNEKGIESDSVTAASRLPQEISTGVDVSSPTLSSAPTEAAASTQTGGPAPVAPPISAAPAVSVPTGPSVVTKGQVGTTAALLATASKAADLVGPVDAVARGATSPLTASQSASDSLALGVETNPRMPVGLKRDDYAESAGLTRYRRFLIPHLMGIQHNDFRIHEEKGVTLLRAQYAFLGFILCVAVLTIVLFVAAALHPKVAPATAPAARCPPPTQCAASLVPPIPTASSPLPSPSSASASAPTPWFMPVPPSVPTPLLPNSP